MINTFRCADKMIEEFSIDIFNDGCPVCKEKCCCSNKSLRCDHKNHCYRKCPASKSFHRISDDDGDRDGSKLMSMHSMAMSSSAEDNDMNNKRLRLMGNDFQPYFGNPGTNNMMSPFMSLNHPFAAYQAQLMMNGQIPNFSLSTGGGSEILNSSSNSGSSGSNDVTSLASSTSSMYNFPMYPPSSYFMPYMPMAHNNMNMGLFMPQMYNNNPSNGNQIPTWNYPFDQSNSTVVNTSNSDLQPPKEVKNDKFN